MPETWSDDERALAARMAHRDIISVRQFGPDDLVALLGIIRHYEGYEEPLLRGRVLGALFFEPSTRTRLSFESAMVRLGGACIGFADARISSASKGESLQDTIRMVEGYCDLIVIRHPQEGAARAASEATVKPVINGGDGANQHPTQTLLDLYTILRRLDRVSGLRIGFLGDLKHGRAAHSLIEASGLLGDNELVLIAPEALRLPARRREELESVGCTFTETSDLASAVEGLDVLYVTRIQQERFGDPLDYERVKNAYTVGLSTLERNSKMVVMHPLPRVTEVDPAIDSSPQAAYFEQAKNGVTVRKALLSLLLGALPE